MIMSKEIKSKINRLVNQWPRGTVSAASYLNRLGFGHDLLVRYKKSGWIQSFGRGAYILYGDKVKWAGAIYALQSQLDLNIHPGGKTALESKGYAHYLPSGRKNIFLYGTQGQVLPSWFNGEHLGVDIVMTRTNLFPSDSKDGLSEFKEKDFSIKISSPERAAMEMLHLVPGKISFEEALLIMENLVSLRPDLVEKLLLMCRSVKVKRLFMYMAEKHGHSWVSDLDLSKIDIGKGKRMIVPNGKYDRKYLITIPQDNREEISG
jgi:hypothetical protein